MVPVGELKQIVFHLGNGASLCAIREGRSVASSMGYSPLDGLTMGTRTGQIDGNAVLRLAEDHGIAGAARILNRESGLLALGGASDMRALHAAGTEQARFAIYHPAKHSPAENPTGSLSGNFASVANERCIIVHDVITSGKTMHEDGAYPRRQKATPVPSRGLFD